MKYSKKTGKLFCDLLGSGKWNLDDVCEQVGISKQTYYNWKSNPKFDFLDILEAAEEKRMDSLKEKAMSGLAKLIDVYEYDEVKREFEPDASGKLKPVKTITTKKRVMPSQTAINFVLTNQDAKRWKNRNNVDHTNNGDSFDFSNFLMNPDSMPPAAADESETPELVDIETINEMPTDQAQPWTPNI